MYFVWRDDESELVKELTRRLVEVPFSSWELDSHDNRDWFHLLLGNLRISCDPSTMGSLFTVEGTTYALDMRGHKIARKLESYIKALGEYQYEHHRKRVMDALREALEVRE